MNIKEFVAPYYNLFKCSIYKVSHSVSDRKTIYIGRDTRIIGGKNFTVERNVVIGKHNYLAVYGNGKFRICESTNIGMYCQMASINEISIDKDVLFGPNVYVADYNHEYQDISEPVSKQGLKQVGKGVHIGQGSWIGKNVVIVGECNIGKHCIIGANSFINGDLPSYSVCAGNPCRPKKK